MSSQSISDIQHTQGPWIEYHGDNKLEADDKWVYVYAFLEGVEIYHSGFEFAENDYITVYEEDAEETFGNRVYWDYVYGGCIQTLKAYVPRVRLAPGNYKVVLASTKSNYLSGQSGVEFDRMYISARSMVESLTLMGEPKIGKQLGCKLTWEHLAAESAHFLADGAVWMQCSRSSGPPLKPDCKTGLEAWIQRFALQNVEEYQHVNIMNEIRVPGEYCVAVSVLTTKSVNAKDYLMIPTMISTNFTVDASASKSPQLTLKGSSTHFTPKQNISIQVKFPGWKLGDVLMMVPVRENNWGNMLVAHAWVEGGLLSHYHVRCKRDAMELPSSECTIELPAREAGSYVAVVGVPAARDKTGDEEWTAEKQGNFLTYYCGGTSSAAINVVSLKDA